MKLILNILANSSIWVKLFSYLNFYFPLYNLPVGAWNHLVKLVFPCEIVEVLDGAVNALTKIRLRRLFLGSL